MTNNMHLHFLDFDADAIHSHERISILTRDPYPTTDDAALSLMLAMHAHLATAIAADAARIAALDFSDDDTDYFPARANTFAALTFAITTDYFYLDNFNRLMHDRDFIDDLLTIDTPDFPLDIDYAE